MPRGLRFHKFYLLNYLNLSKTTFLLNLLQVYLIKLMWLGSLAASATTRRYCQLPLSLKKYLLAGQGPPTSLFPSFEI